ncbi:MAG: hypothetical protein EOO44_16295 [Flavobacterium sp.]|nr:MAG: hypothetical protein EOO44_16295 [Flavobacterium sp.]
MSLNLFGQTGNVGVLTTAPRTTLDVNGTLNVNNEINVGGSDTAVGNSGTVGDLLAARADTVAVWRKYDLPAGYLDGVILTANYNRSSVTGVTFPSAAATVDPYSEDDPITASWLPIPNTEVSSVRVTKATNKVNISVQTVAQITGNSGVGSFGCGIFVDNKLKLVRTNNVAGITGSYRILNFNASLTLTVGNVNRVQFACIRRNLPTGNTLSIGVSQAASTALTPQMAGTSLSVQVLEPIQ